MDASALDISTAQIIASNGRLHQQMIETIAAIRPQAERRHAWMLLEDETLRSADQD
jgi:hypothetical protein